jgi:hypothetical protein
MTCEPRSRRQPFKPLDANVLLRLSRLAKAQCNFAILGPIDERLTGQFAASLQAQRIGPCMQLNQTATRSVQFVHLLPEFRRISSL